MTACASIRACWWMSPKSIRASTCWARNCRFPILLAPTGGQGFIRPEGDLDAARGAAAAHATYVISSSASLPVDQVARASGGTTWFQLYVQKDRGFTKALVQRAEDAGCPALCVPVDSPP